jgi:TRAP transporter TAXI family solute receptor
VLRTAKWLRVAAVLAAAATMLFGIRRSRQAGPVEILTIAAMPPGTSWYVFAATLARLLERQLPEHYSVEVLARGGGIGNPTLVERGKATIALSQVATAVWARDGHPMAYPGNRHPNIRALAGGLNSVWVTALLRQDYIRRTGNDSLEKALRSDRPPRIVMKPPGSTVPVVADIIFETFGTSRQDIRSRGGDIIQVSANQIADLLRDGRADLYLETAIQGHPAVTEVATTVPVRFLDFPPELLAALSKLGMKPSPLPAWFRGQERPTAAVDCGTVLITHKDLPEHLAYRITKTICENRDTMVRAHKAWADFDPSRGGLPEAAGIPLHAGAERYYREKGWL